jgi:hypothetical protein
MAAFNRKVTNKVTLRLATVPPGFGIVARTGRRSGATSRTPVNVFRRAGRLRFALTYGRGDWVRNVLAGGPSSLRTRQGTFADPRAHDRRRRRAPRPAGSRAAGPPPHRHHRRAAGERRHHRPVMLVLAAFRLTGERTFV